MASSTAAKTFNRSGLHPGPLRRPHRPSPIAGPPRADTSIIEYYKEREQLDSGLQIAWSENIGDGEIRSSLYLQVAVLLISWDTDCDDLNTKEEVKSFPFFDPS